METVDGNIVVEHDIQKPTRSTNNSGIKFFEGNPLPSGADLTPFLAMTSPTFLRDVRHIWRPEETAEAAGTFFHHKKVIIEGAPQNGKGTILYGLSEICDHFGWGHLFINGHFCETPADPIINALSEATDRRLCLFFDSFDYLFLKAARHRKMNKANHEVRTDTIMQALDGFPHPIAITEHNDEWKERFINPVLYDKYSPTLDKFKRYVIPLEMQSSDSIARFLMDHEIPSADAAFFSEIEESDFVRNRLTHDYGDKSKVDLTLSSTKYYPVLKKLARFFNGDFRQTLDSARNNDPKAVTSLSRMILEAEYERVFLTTLRK